MCGKNACFHLVVAIPTKRYCSGAKRIPEDIPLSYFPELSCRLADVREIFGIPRRGTSLYHRAMSEIFLLFLSADVSDY